MARLIDADTLKGYLMQSTVYAWDAEQDAIAHRWVLHAIDTAPTIDAEPVIRCKDCKWFGRMGCAIEVVDETDMPKENDFCSFAVLRRKGRHEID